MPVLQLDLPSTPKAFAAKPFKGQAQKQAQSIKHTHQLLVGSPCRHCCSTTPSSARTTLPSNLQIPHCNRRAAKLLRNRRHLGLRNPCHGLCSTIPSSAPTTLLANSRIHRRSCK